MIKYFCSDGSRVSQATIDRRRSESYREHDDGTTSCRGCNGRAEGHAHILSQSACKKAHKTELIWNPVNWFKACHKCNSAWESFKGDACRELLNYKENLEILKELNHDTYLKYCNL